MKPTANSAWLMPGGEWGISENKAHLREPKVVRMGAEIDGERGYVSAPMNKKLEVGFFCHLVDEPPASSHKDHSHGSGSIGALFRVS